MKLMYKTTVYTLVNGGITHQKQANIKKVILRSMTLPINVKVLLTNIIFLIFPIWLKNPGN